MHEVGQDSYFCGFDTELNIVIDSLFGEALLKLSLNIITPEINSQIDKRVLSKYQSFTNPNLSIQVNFQNQ